MRWYWWLLIIVIVAIGGWYFYIQYQEGKKMEAVRKAKAEKRNVEESNNQASL